jgi:Lar family restriction alleviation protein
MSDLLPCPFCGGAAYVQTTDDAGCFVGCVACYCTVGEAYDRSAMPEHLFRTAEEAIAAWNRRTPASTVPSEARSADTPTSPNAREEALIAGWLNNGNAEGVHAHLEHFMGVQMSRSAVNAVFKAIRALLSTSSGE